MASKRGGVGSRKACAFPPEDDYSAVKLLMYGDASPSVRSAGAAAIREAAAACAADKLLRSKGTPDSFERGKVLLYYKYVAVDDPQALRVWQRDLCAALDLRGRIHVGTEGINGTVGGTCEATRLYVEAMIKHSRWGQLFAGTDFKTSEGGRQCFPNMFEVFGANVPQHICSPRASLRATSCEEASTDTAKKLETEIRFFEVAILSLTVV
eukprot:g2954.t1